MLATQLQTQENQTTPIRKSPWFLGEHIETPKGRLQIIEMRYIQFADEWEYTFKLHRPRRIPDCEEIFYRESRLKRWQEYLNTDLWDLLAYWAGA